MYCTSPSLLSQVPVGLSEPVVEEDIASDALLLYYGFLMDGVQLLQNISLTGVGGAMLIFPDPTFEPFEGGSKQFFYSKNEYLTINVSQLYIYTCVLWLYWMYDVLTILYIQCVINILYVELSDFVYTYICLFIYQSSFPMQLVIQVLRILLLNSKGGF